MDANNDRIDQLLRAAVPEIKYEFDRVNRATSGNVSGEIRLMAALLQDAVEIIQGRRVPGMYGDQKHRSDPRQEAIDWMLDDDDSVLSFLSCCEQFQLNPEAVRAQVVGRKRAA